MSSVLISVVVPLFDTEQYLDECLSSIRRQTLHDIEIICVNDCSPDNSVDIVQSHQQKDKRIILIEHSENLGLGGARNTGIRSASGDYISFVDSDDTMNPEMLETLWKHVDEDQNDVVICGYNEMDSQGNILTVNNRQFRVSQMKRATVSSAFKMTNPASWNKLWRKTLFIDNDIWFPNFLHFQDAATTPRLLFVAEGIKSIDDRLYNYRHRKDSTSNSFSPKHIVDYFRVFDLIYSFLDIRTDIPDSKYNEMLDCVDSHLSYCTKSKICTLLSEGHQIQNLRLLLMFKIGYLENRKLLEGRTKKQLVASIRSIRTSKDLANSIVSKNDNCR